MMRSKREGILFLIFILFCILATGFYDRVFDDNNFSEEDANLPEMDTRILIILFAK